MRLKKKKKLWVLARYSKGKVKGKAKGTAEGKDRGKEKNMSMSKDRPRPCLRPETQKKMEVKKDEDGSVMEFPKAYHPTTS